MKSNGDLQSWLFKSLMFEAEAEKFRTAGVQVGVDTSKAEASLLADALAPFSITLRNDSMRMARLYALIFCFENSVRELLRSRLGEGNPDWWSSPSVPNAVCNNADSRQAKSHKDSWLEGANSDVLGFVDFGDLAKIINNNWQFFEDLIPSQHWLSQRLDELEAARNFIAHNRMLSDAEFARIEMYINDWNRQIGL